MSAIKLRRTSFISLSATLESRESVRFPLLSRSCSRRFISGVSPIDCFFTGVCYSFTLLTHLGDSGGGNFSFDSSCTCIKLSAYDASTETAEVRAC